MHRFVGSTSGVGTEKCGVVAPEGSQQSTPEGFLGVKWGQMPFYQIVYKWRRATAPLEIPCKRVSTDLLYYFTDEKENDTKIEPCRPLNYAL